MGSFLGHVGPGAMFLVFGLWRMVNVVRQLVEKRKAFSYQSLTLARICHRTIPLEGLALLALPGLEMVCEISTAFRDGVLVNYGNLQHIAIDCAFLLVGIAELLNYKCGSGHVPDNLVKFLLVLAHALHALQFMLHDHMSTMMESSMHHLSALTGALAALCVALDILLEAPACLALGHAFFTVVNGLWFEVIGVFLVILITRQPLRPASSPMGFVLFSSYIHLPSWDQTSHQQLVVVHSVFAGMFYLTVVALAVIYACLCRRRTHQVANHVEMHALTEMSDESD